MKKAAMMKFLGLCLAASMYATSAEAAQINTIVDTGSGMFAEPEKSIRKLMKRLKVVFFQMKKM